MSLFMSDIESSNVALKWPKVWHHGAFAVRQRPACLFCVPGTNVRMDDVLYLVS